MERGTKPLFPYRTFLDIMINLEGKHSVNFFEFAFCLYPISETSKSSITMAINDINYARKKYPNWVDISINNREQLLKELNEYYKTTLTDIDLWGSRSTTIKNQFGYFANHLSFLDDYIKVEGSGNKKTIQLIPEKIEDLKKLLEQSRSIEKQPKEQLLAKYTEAFMLVTLFLL